ncbi:MAG: HDOD domain-containing protein [Planctomycetales bacterium]|nr:HDOD domain-containing protein [Planctomycetales bacterium]
MQQTALAALEKLIAQAERLYTLPSVAMDVMRLTESDSVDIRQLKETIERDPALSVKLLRVVNSSLFGLSGKVADLNQALALLGVEPLKMLVLGFSLPEGLFAEMAGEPLQRYWTVSLTRAVSARSLAERFEDVTSDEAFLAGLLKDIGQLVMVQQLGEPYVRFLETTTEKHGRLLELEGQALGFDHCQLSAALMRRWSLPERLAQSIEPPDSGGAEARRDSLRQVVVLADLMVDLVLDRRLHALPELLELGHQACGLDKQQLNLLLEPLQTKVDQLASAMSVELTEGLDYPQVLLEAHQRLAQTAEKAIGLFLEGKTDDQLAESLLAETHEVRLAMREFLRDVQNNNPPPPATRAEGAHLPRRMLREAPQPVELEKEARDRLHSAADKLAVKCRIERTELSLAVMQYQAVGKPDEKTLERALKLALATGQERAQLDQPIRLTLDEHHVAMLMPSVDRRDAVQFVAASVESASLSEHVRLKGGVATITLVPNRFDANRLMDGALGCLTATLASGSTAVKSIEVY